LREDWKACLFRRVNSVSASGFQLHQRFLLSSLSWSWGVIFGLFRQEIGSGTRTVPGERVDGLPAVPGRHVNAYMAFPKKARSKTDLTGWIGVSS